MNHIEMKKVKKSENWSDYEWFIDGMRLSWYLHDNKVTELPDNVEPFDDLCPAWTKKLDCFGDVRFVWNLLEQEKAVLPIYVCPEDLDFSCIVVVVEVEKTRNFVYWNRIGFVQEVNYDFSIEKEMGILDTASYTEEDWEKYGDNIALAEVDSNEWCQWISENWDEELFRRRMNYTRPAYEDHKNIIWFANPYWMFDRNRYEDMIAEYWEESLDEIMTYNCFDMSMDKCVNLMKRISRNGIEKLEEHKKIYGEVLLHIYASEEIGNPLFELLQNKRKNKYILILSKFIELMWRYGDDAVKNVVDATLLEKLSEDVDVWNRFGKNISSEFIDYINNDLLKNNIAMCEVTPIKV